MLGAICGDIVGSRFEFDNYKGKDFQFWHKRCRNTDDTVMTCAVASALLLCEGDYSCLEEKAAEELRKFGHLYPNAGYGGRFFNWIFSKNPRPYNSFGNGSAMRVSPVAWVANSLQEAEQYAKAVSMPTHNHPEGIKGARATAAAIYLARTGAGKGEIEAYIAQNYYPMDKTEFGKKPEEIREDYEFDVTCQGSVPQAIRCFLEGDSFEDVIRTAVSIGGDSDTIGAIAGAIAEAYYGMDEDMIEHTLSYLDLPLQDVVSDFCAVFREGE